MRALPIDRNSLITGLTFLLLGVVTFNSACSVHPFQSSAGTMAQGPQTTPLGSQPIGKNTLAATFHEPYPSSAFFVSSAGDDLADGRSPDTAWRTLAKVNASIFSPNDYILFQRGSAWRESLKISSSGGPGNPITFGDYGDVNLAKPKFLGSDILTNSQFQVAGPGLYAYAFVSEVYSVLANSTFMLFPQGQAADTLPGSWSYASGVLTINSPSSDPRTNGQIYEAVTREDIINTNAQSHLVIQNLVTDESAHYNGGYGFRIEQSQDILLDGCEAYRAGKHHFGVINTTGFIGQNLYAAYAMPGQHWQPGDSASAFVSYGDQTGVPAQTSKWLNVVWEHPEDVQSPDNNYYAFFTHGPNMGSVYISNMVSHLSNVSISNGESPSATVQLVGGWIDNARLEVSGTGILVDGVHISGLNGTVDLTGVQLTLQNSLIEGTNLGSQWYQTAVAVRDVNNTVRFNTIVLDPSAANSHACLTLVNQGLGIHMYGNIFISNGRVLQLYDSMGALDSSSVAESHDNLFIANATFAFISMTPSFHFVDETIADWQASGFDQNSIVGNPLFLDATNRNFSLALGSPAIDAIAAGAISNPPVTDITGGARPKGNGYDIGAYEF